LGNRLLTSLQNIKNLSRPNKTDTTEALPELSGSDLDPPDFIIAQSTRLVEDWLDACDFAMAFESDAETKSTVSLLGGGIERRPAIDVPIWKTITPRRGFRRSITVSNVNIKDSRSRIKDKIANISQCVYDRPRQKLGLESEVVEQLNEETTNKEMKIQKGQLLRKLRTLVSRNKSDKSIQKIERNNEASQLRVDRVQEYEDREFLMKGGRSSGRSASIIALAPDSRRSSSSFELSSQSERPSTVSNIKDNLHQVDMASRYIESNSSASSQLSSRSSNINFGSIIEQPISPSKLADRENRETQRDRSPDIFVPTAPEPIQQQATQSSTAGKRLRRKPSFESFRPSTPKPIEQTYVSPSKVTQTPRQIPTMSVREPGGFVREKMQLGNAGQGISMFAENRARRRADQMANGTGQFGRPENQTANMFEGVSEFTKNREKRRSERHLAGPVLETKGAGAGKTLSAEKRNRGMGGFNVEEEVASGAAWERRMKRAQSSSKRPVSETYRAEERQKYWTSQK